MKFGKYKKLKLFFFKLPQNPNNYGRNKRKNKTTASRVC